MLGYILIAKIVTVEMVVVVAEAETAMITVAAGSAAGVAVSAVAEVAGMAAGAGELAKAAAITNTT